MIKRLAVCAAMLLAGCGGGGSPLVPQLRPVDGGVITSAFGPRQIHPLLGAIPGGHHDGYDIAVAAGSPIRATKAGEVTFAAERGGYGQTVILRHEGGYATLYGHASRLLVGVGERVAAGQAIALVGSSGLSTGPHVHYELWHGGVPIDPGALPSTTSEAQAPWPSVQAVAFRPPVSKTRPPGPDVAARHPRTGSLFPHELPGWLPSRGGA